MEGAFDFSVLDRAVTALNVADERIADVSARIARKRRRNATKAPPFWARPDGLLLDYVWYDRSEKAFVVSFAHGPTYRLSKSVIRRTGDVIGTELDAFKHGVIVVFDDFSVTSFAGDLVLFHREPRYQRAVRREVPASARRRTNVGSRIRRARLAQKRTASEIAAELGLAPSNYSRLESGKHRPRVELLVRISEVLRVPLSTLVGRK